MDDRIRLKPADRLVQDRRLTEVPLKQEQMTTPRLHRLDVRTLDRRVVVVVEIIQDADLHPQIQERLRRVRADKAGPARDQYTPARPSLRRCGSVFMLHAISPARKD